MFALVLEESMRLPVYLVLYSLTAHFNSGTSSLDTPFEMQSSTQRFRKGWKRIAANEPGLRIGDEKLVARNAVVETMDAEGD